MKRRTRNKVRQLHAHDGANTGIKLSAALVSIRAKLRKKKMRQVAQKRTWTQSSRRKSERDC